MFLFSIAIVSILLNQTTSRNVVISLSLLDIDLQLNKTNLLADDGLRWVRSAVKWHSISRCTNNQE